MLRLFLMAIVLATIQTSKLSFKYLFLLLLMKFMNQSYIFAISKIFKVYSTEVSKNCANGPEHWCESIQNANECGAFKHCLQTIWTRHSYYIDAKEDTTRDINPSPCINCQQCIVGAFKVIYNKLKFSKNFNLVEVFTIFYLSYVQN
jgi:hypothetical protein